LSAHLSSGVANFGASDPTGRQNWIAHLIGRGQRLTQQLLTFARKQVSKPVIINPNRLLSDLAEAAHEHGLPDDLLVLGKPYRLEDLANKIRIVIGG
jgi:hypothetical protein